MFAVYRSRFRKKGFSVQHRLVIMLENVGAVLSDLSKAFDCLTRNLHVSKAHTLKLTKGKKHKIKVGILLAKYQF